MLKLFKYVASLIALFIFLAIATFFYLIGSGVAESEREVRRFQEKYTSMTEAEFEFLVDVSRNLVLNLEGGVSITLEGDDIPNALQSYEPKRVAISNRGVVLDLYWYVDTGADVSVEFDGNDNWTIYGWFGEHTERVRLWETP